MSLFAISIILLFFLLLSEWLMVKFFISARKNVEKGEMGKALEAALVGIFFALFTSVFLLTLLMMGYVILTTFTAT